MKSARIASRCSIHTSRSCSAVRPRVSKIATNVFRWPVTKYSRRSGCSGSARSRTRQRRVGIGLLAWRAARPMAERFEVEMQLAERAAQAPLRLDEERTRRMRARLPGAGGDEQAVLRQDGIELARA